MIRKTVVIIDDEVDLCNLIKRFILDLNSGYTVHLAHTLKDGFELIRQVQPDILFIDNNLPDGLGCEKLMEVHESLPNCRLNLISASQYLPADLLVRGFPVTIIEKPLRLNHLKDYL